MPELYKREDTGFRFLEFLPISYEIERPTTASSLINE